jgi:hypothetical protein
MINVFVSNRPWVKAGLSAFENACEFHCSKIVLYVYNSELVFGALYVFEIKLLMLQPHEFFRQVLLAAVYKYCTTDVMSGCWDGCLQ